MIIKRNNFEDIKKYNYSIAVGNFDGIHKGHKYLLESLIKYKSLHNSKIAVLSFVPHPVKVIAPKKWKKNLVKFRTKYEKLKILGIDALLLISFSKKFSQITAEDFILRFLIKKLNVKNIIVGDDFRFGYMREGNTNLLKQYEIKEKFRVISIKKKADSKNNTYSSSLIRNLIEKGNIRKANSILGYYWEVQGKVIKGKALGRKLGFPTANIKYLYQISPQKGIYACWIQIQGEKKFRMSAASTGTRPHYNGKEEILEVFIFNYSGNLYQKRIKVLFVEKIRNEEKFSSDKNLINRMEKDCEEIKRILSKEITYDKTRIKNE